MSDNTHSHVPQHKELWSVNISDREYDFYRTAWNRDDMEGDWVTAVHKSEIEQVNMGFVQE